MHYNDTKLIRDSYRSLGLGGGDSTPRGVWGHVPPGILSENLCSEINSGALFSSSACPW